jgi:hypothetical protein
MLVKTPPILDPLGFVPDFRHNRPMLLSRRNSRPIAWLIAACLLFAQTAAAAYACSRADVAAATAEVAAPPCSGHIADDGPAGPQGDGALAQGNVCEVHCQTASLPDGGALDLPAIVVVARWEIPASTMAPDPSTPASEIEARSAAPPLLALLPRLLL